MAMITQKIPNIITLSHYISVEVYCAKLQFSFKHVVSHKGVIHHTAVGCCSCRRVWAQILKDYFQDPKFSQGKKSFGEKFSVSFVFELQISTKARLKHI